MKVYVVFEFTGGNVLVKLVGDGVDEISHELSQVVLFCERP